MLEVVQILSMTYQAKTSSIIWMIALRLIRVGMGMIDQLVPLVKQEVHLDKV
jgi:hypothetical protein